jgi:FkbM family methyltransferase
MPLLHNAALLLKSPGTALAYARYRFKPERQYDGFKLGNFSCFSEYLNSDFLSPTEQRFLTSYPFPPGAMIDVGAHIGFVSLLIAKCYQDRTIYAFEGSSSTCSSLTGNLELNKIRNVEAHNLAVTDHEGLENFNAHPRYRATNSIALESDLYIVSTPCTTIDCFAERYHLQQIALLKIDVEGYEHLVLKGAEKALRKTHVVFYEVCPSNTRKAGTDIELPFRILEEHGFTIHRFDDDVLVPAALSDIKNVVLDNWIAIKPSTKEQ